MLIALKQNPKRIQTYHPKWPENPLMLHAQKMKFS